MSIQDSPQVVAPVADNGGERNETANTLPTSLASSSARTGDTRMNTGARAYNAYKTAEIKTLSQRELIIKLYEGADRFLIHAQTAIYNKEWEVSHEKCSKAKAVFMELLSTLNFEEGGGIAGQLRDLYLFLISEIIESNLTKDAERIQKLHPIIASLLEAWRQIDDNGMPNAAGGSDCGNTFIATT